MVTSKAPITSTQDMLVGLLCAVVAAWLAATVYNILFDTYATSRFWETWFAPGSAAALGVPVVIFALLAGAGVGMALGFAFQRQAMKVAAVSALLQFVAGVVSGGIASSLLLAVGLVLGALPQRTQR
jgi:hypothetical protein